MTSHLLPHGQCWMWNWQLIILHSVSDFVTGIDYLVVPAIAYMIYRITGVAKLSQLYPRLWRRGCAFVLFCGLSHLGNVIEIWNGGIIYYLTGINKVAMAIASVLFAFDLWKNRNEIILTGKIVSIMHDHAKNGKISDKKIPPSLEGL